MREIHEVRNEYDDEDEVILIELSELCLRVKATEDRNQGSRGRRFSDDEEKITTELV